MSCRLPKRGLNPEVLGVTVRSFIRPGLRPYQVTPYGGGASLVLGILSVWCRPVWSGQPGLTLVGKQNESLTSTQVPDVRKGKESPVYGTGPRGSNSWLLVTNQKYRRLL